MPKSKPRCFVISHFGKPNTKTRKEADHVFDKIIRPACRAEGALADRADRMLKPGRVTDKILAAIQQHDVCIADLSGRSANVFYELAIAQTLGRPVVLMHRGRTVPFDVTGYEILYYDLKKEHQLRHVEKLREYLRAVLKPGYNPPALMGAHSIISPQRKEVRFSSGAHPDVLSSLRQFLNNAYDVTIFSTSFRWVDDDFRKILHEKRKRNGEVLLFIPEANDAVRLIRDEADAQIREYVASDYVRFTLIDRRRPAGKKLRVGQELHSGFVITDFDQHTDSELIGAFSALIETAKKHVPLCE